MPFRILHISDMHFGPECQYRSTDAREAGRLAAARLSFDLKSRKVEHSFQAVVISGDLTWSNQPDEFKASGEFILQLSRELGVPQDNFILIPGNHDITWSETDLSLEKKYRLLLRQQAEKDYRSFYSSTFGRSPAEYLAMAKLFIKERILIVGLNSCRLHEKRNAGLGYVGRDQIEGAIRAVRTDRKYEINEKEFFKIAVLHHHLLPAADLDLSDLDKPPSDRRFSMTVDADGILDMLLADNFGLILHGHLHLPFCAVERRLTVRAKEPQVDNNSHVAISGVGSFSVRRPHAIQNHYQIVEIDDNTVAIRGVELDASTSRGSTDSPVVKLERSLLTTPPKKLKLRPRSSLFHDIHAQQMEESAVLAERVAQRDDFATEFLWQSILPACRRREELSTVPEAHVRGLFDSVLESWRGEHQPMENYEAQKKRLTLTFTEYILHLMVAYHGK